ncbi:MAG: hypothetical protein SFU85_06345 [Candidatus Methylacidiphilales bacterium]|nr:hypothetical protein [Candidatus Methylacidiphilales bacterium]
MPAAEIQDVRYAELKINTEAYKNKHVVYEAPYLGIVPNLPHYVVASGFDMDKNSLLTVGSLHLPVVAEKSDAINGVLVGLRKGDVVRVTGRVREFRATPGNRRNSPYYLELDELVFVRKARQGEVAVLDENAESVSETNQGQEEEAGRKNRRKN